MTGVRRFGPLLAVGLLLAAAAVAAMLASPQIRTVQPGGRPTPGLGQTFNPTPGTAPPLAVPEATPEADNRAVRLPGWLQLAVQVLCALIVLAVVGLLLWYLLRTGLRLRERRHLPDAVPAAAPPPARERVIAAVEAGLSDLDDADADPRWAVIACWLRLEQAAAAAGTPRHVGDTPTELVTRLLGGHAVSAPVLYALAEVYREARYATHRVDAATRDQARAALGQVRAELSREGATVP